jgi:hypothetical protein
MHLPTQSRQVTLKDIHGAEIPNVWIQVARPIDLDERTPAVLIVGSAVELIDRSMAIVSGADLQEHCQAVGRLLASRGLNLVADACPGIPQLIEQAYLASRPRGVVVDLSILRGPHEPDTDRAYSPTGFPAGGDLLIFCGTGFEVLSIVNTYCADVVLLVGGGLGSLMEGIIAVISDLPVVCYSPAGGVAGEMQPLFERYRSRYKNLQIETVSTLDALDDYLQEFSTRFHRAGRSSRLGNFCAALDPELHSAGAGAQIVVDGELQSISYRFGPCQIDIPRPQLAIDDARLLQDPSAGSALRTYLDAHPRSYSFDGVAIEVPVGLPQKVWCPSIDTFVLLSTMRSHLGRLYDTALDLGSGTGLIALWLAAGNHAAETYGIDKNAEATRCSAVNAAALGLAQRCHFRTATYQRFRRDAPPFQLIACNPPYVPRVRGEERLEDGSFEGVSLVLELLSSLDSALAAGGVCFLGLSSTSWTHPEVRQRMQSLIAQKRAVMLHEAAVPFKVADLLLNRPWLDQLVSDGGVFHQLGERYAYWHRIQIWRLTR